jgi:hypothetical protein
MSSPYCSGPTSRCEKLATLEVHIPGVGKRRLCWGCAQTIAAMGVIRAAAVPPRTPLAAA